VLKILALIAAVLFAMFAGLALAVVGQLGFLVLFPLVGVVLILYDYRVAVVILAMINPLSGSMLVPKLEGLNPYTYLSAAAVAGFMLSRFTSSKPIVWPPKVLLIFLVFPLLAGFLLGIPHLDELQRNLHKVLPDGVVNTVLYFKKYVYQPLLLVAFSVLLANAVAESRKPERFVVLFALSAVTVVAYVMIFTLSSGVSWGPHKWVISQAGMHYNGYGQLFALAFGPLLYVAFSERGWERYFFGLAAMVVFVGLVLNFARAGMLAGLITVGVFIWQRRSFAVATVVVGLMVLVFMFAPEEWRSRMFQGSDEVSTAYRGELYGALTSGRLISWMDLFPEVLSSPLYGRGMQSTLLSDAVTRGLYLSDHPHNMYLQLLLDVGILGLAMVLFFFYLLLRKMLELSRSEATEPRLRAFFAGSFASFAAVLVVSFTGYDWFPANEQAFLWFSIGLLFAYWNRSAGDVAVRNADTATKALRFAPQSRWRFVTKTPKKV
jgi:O-antigen ligase